MKKTVVVVNPRSQNGKLERRWPEIERTLRRELGDFEAVMTQAPGDGARLSRAALDRGADVVCAFGGDGTIHEVTNGFFDAGGKPVRPTAALAVLPHGTGGDFRKTALIPKDIEGAARIIRAGQTRTVDVGRLEYLTHEGKPASCVFINIASFGIGGLVDQIANKSSKALGGKVSFFVAAARAGARYKNQPVRVSCDGEPAVETTIYNVAVANGYFGGGMLVAPEAQLDDARFDVVTIGDLSFVDALKSSRLIYKGTHLTHPKISARRAAQVHAAPLRAGDHVLLDVDGEALGRLPATFTMLPQALTLIAPHA